MRARRAPDTTASSKAVCTTRFFFDKENILISRDTNYTRPLQLRNTLMAIRMHPAKK
jgi:hypothetical protein